MGGARRLHERVAGRHGVGRGVGADRGRAGQHDEQLPLDGVGMLRANRGAGRHAPQLQVEGMSTAPRTDVAHAAERERDIFEIRVVPAGG